MMHENVTGCVKKKRDAVVAPRIAGDPVRYDAAKPPCEQNVSRCF